MGVLVPETRLGEMYLQETDDSHGEIQSRWTYSGKVLGTP